MSKHVKSRISSSSSKSASSTYSMHKGSGPVQRKRKPQSQSPNDQSKKRRIARSASETQSGQGLRDGILPRLTERQQLALAMEESKKAAAALQAKDRQASRQMDSEDDDSDCQGASDSEQDSVSEDESAVKPHRRAIKSGQPARSLTSQHSDVASQLGQHDHRLCAKSGRLESLSGGSKQSQSTSSKLRLTADSSNQLASTSQLQHVDSDADSHPRQAHSQPDRSVKRSVSVERQRTSDVSSRDILDTAEDSKMKDEMQSQDVATVRLPLEDGMDLLDKRTQRLAVRKALSHTMPLQPEALSQSDMPESASHLHKLQHAKSDLNGYSASPKHALKALKVRVKSEDKPHQQQHGLEASIGADAAQNRKGKAGMQTPRDHHMLSSDPTPRSRNGQHPRALDSFSQFHHLVSHPNAPMAQLVESDLFGDFSPRKSGMEARASATASPKLQNAAELSGPLHLQTSDALPDQAADAVIAEQPAQKTGLKVVLKQHRLAVSDAAKAASQMAPAASTAAEQPTTPVAKHLLLPVQAEMAVLAEIQDKPQEAGSADPSTTQKAVKRKAGKPGRPRAIKRAATQDVLLSPASDPRCQAPAEQNALDTAGPSAAPLAPPETDAQLLEPSPSAAKGRPKGRKPGKQASMSSLGSRRLRSTCVDEGTAKAAFQSFDSKKQKGSVLFGACSLLTAEREAWTAAFNPSSGLTSISMAQSSRPPQDESNPQDVLPSDFRRQEATQMLHAASTSALSDLKQQHELEGKLLTSSMMVASQNTVADRTFSRRQSATDVQAGRRQSSATEQPSSRQPGAFAAACAHLWAPLQRNRDADKLYWSKKYSMEEMGLQDVRSPRRSSSHRTYDSGWDDLQARQSSEIEILQSYQRWCSK